MPTYMKVSRRKWISLQNYWNTWREESFKRLFDDFSSISRIRLTLTKENPPMGADCREAGVEIEAER